MPLGADTYKHILASWTKAISRNQLHVGQMLAYA